MNGELVQYQSMPLTAVQVKAQVQLIQEVMAAVMVKDVHYGTIPGTPKPTLYKPGSEKILSTFRIAAHPKEIEDLSTFDEIRYRVKVYGVAMENEQVLFGVGIGECSSNEDKFKWRKPLCDEEFNETPEDRRRIVWKKYDNKPYQQKQVRTNPSDVANTVLKMAKKRAQIDMTLTATGASDVFDQDLEDLPEGMVGNMSDAKPPIKQPQKKESAPQKKATPGACSRIIIVKEVTEQTETKEGKKMQTPLNHIISDDGTDFRTFEKKDAEVATANIGKQVNITFNETKWGNDLKTIEAVAERAPGEEG
jgi:hypothetical protein